MRLSIFYQNQMKFSVDDGAKGMRTYGYFVRCSHATDESESRKGAGLWHHSQQWRRSKWRWLVHIPVVLKGDASSVSVSLHHHPLSGFLEPGSTVYDEHVSWLVSWLHTDRNQGDLNVATLEMAFSPLKKAQSLFLSHTCHWITPPPQSQEAVKTRCGIL